MIRYAAMIFVSSLFPLIASAQIVDTSVCEVANHPMKYDGKMVRVKGLVQADFDSFFIRGESCNSGIWLSYPAGTRAKSGPAAAISLQLAANAGGAPAKARAAVRLERTPAFETFDAMLSAKAKIPGMCLGCVRNDVMATLTGRIDGSDQPGIRRDAGGKVTGLEGFGNMNLWGVRMVLQSVADPAAQEIDFSKAPKISGDSAGGGGKDFAASLKKAEEAFGKDNASARQIQRALDAVGGPGVAVVYEGAAEVPAGEGEKGQTSSPDGLLLTIHLDGERLKGDALSRGIAHEGELVADLREAGAQPYQTLQQRAWQTVLIVTIGSRQKSLTLPGGMVLWSEAWPEAERNANASANLSTYLTSREQAP